MKSAAAYYLIILYSLAVCKPVLPLITDFLSHTFWHQKHITAVHHENGKDHLHYELLDANDDEESRTSLAKISEAVSEHIPFEENTLLVNRISALKETRYKGLLPELVIKMLYPPPRS